MELKGADKPEFGFIKITVSNPGLSQSLLKYLNSSTFYINKKFAMKYNINFLGI